MPLTAKGEKIWSAMLEQYGKEKGQKVFYASENKGTIKGVHADKPKLVKRKKIKVKNMPS